MFVCFWFLYLLSETLLASVHRHHTTKRQKSKATMSTGKNSGKTFRHKFYDLRYRDQTMKHIHKHNPCRTQALAAARWVLVRDVHDVHCGSHRHCHPSTHRMHGVRWWTVFRTSSHASRHNIWTCHHSIPHGTISFQASHHWLSYNLITSCWYMVSRTDLRTHQWCAYKSCRNDCSCYTRQDVSPHGRNLCSWTMRGWRCWLRITAGRSRLTFWDSIIKLMLSYS